ncbi:MAG: four helix bundle protein [Acidobacteria bacterium]|nr:four helix bundle protein [Acidobacteriota bacterium]MCH8016958.1 four helix bundle protein [Acidobacteriota bacterium]
MPTIKQFEDLEVWRAARALTKAIYRVSSTGQFARDFQLTNQIRRSANSVMSNIAEGFEGDGNREFQHFLAVAKGSCGEVRSQLFIAFDQGYVALNEFQSLCQEATKVSRLLSALMKHLRQSQMGDRKYK